MVFLAVNLKIVYFHDFWFKNQTYVVGVFLCDTRNHVVSKAH